MVFLSPQRAGMSHVEFSLPGMMWRSLLRSILGKQGRCPYLALSGLQRLRQVQSPDNPGPRSGHVCVS